MFNVCYNCSTYVAGIIEEEIMGTYDCDCINNLKYDRRERKQKGQSQSAALATQSADLIDRQQAINGKIVIQRANGVEIYSDEAVLVEYLKNLPSAQPEPREGYWIDKGWSGDWVWQTDGRGNCWRVIVCSECGKSVSVESNYCPHCGAKMKGEKI